MIKTVAETYNMRYKHQKLPCTPTECVNFRVESTTMNLINQVQLGKTYISSAEGKLETKLKNSSDLTLFEVNANSTLVETNDFSKRALRIRVC